MADEQTRIRPIPLPANSFEFGDTEKALDKAVSIQDATKHSERAAEAIRSSAVLKNVLEGMEGPALPEGTKLGEIVLDGGQKVQAPVSIAAEADSGAEAAKMELPSTAAVQDAAEQGGAETAGDEPATSGAGNSKASGTRSRD